MNLVDPKQLSTELAKAFEPVAQRLLASALPQIRAALREEITLILGELSEKYVAYSGSIKLPEMKVDEG